MREMLNDVAVVAEPLPTGDTGSFPNPDIPAYGLSVSINSPVGFASLSASQRTYSRITPSPSSPILTDNSYGIPYDPNHNATACTSVDSSVFNEYCNETAAPAYQNVLQDAQIRLQEISPSSKKGAGVMFLENLILASMAGLIPNNNTEQSPWADASSTQFWKLATLSTRVKPLFRARLINRPVFRH